MKKRNKRGILRITTIILVVIIIGVGSLMDLLIQKTMPWGFMFLTHLTQNSILIIFPKKY